MADIKYDIRVDIESKLGKLRDEIKGVSKEFEDMSSKIGSYAAVLSATLIGLGASAAKFADEMADVAAANETSIASVLGLASAMQGLGGSADNVGRFLQTLNNNIDSAASGNMKMASTLAKLGVGINELGSFSQEQIRDTLIKNIAAIEDPVARSAKAMEVFGKAALGMDFTKLAADIAENTAKYGQYETSIKNAADAFDNMGKIIKDIKIATTVAFEPLFKYIKDLKPNIDGLVIAIRLLAAALGLAVGASVLAGFRTLIGLVETLTIVSKKNPLIAIASVVLGIAGAMGVWNSATTDVKGAQEDLKTNTDEIGKKTQKVVRDTSDLKDAYKKQVDSLKQVTQAFDQQLKQIQDKLKLEGDSLRMSDDQKKIADQIATIETNKQTALISLKQKFDALDADSRARNKSAYEQESALITKNAELAKASAEEQIRKNQEYVNSIRNLGNAMAALNTGREEVFNIQAKNQIAISGTQERIALEEKYNSIIRIRQALVNATAGLSEEEKKAAIQAISITTTRIQNMGTEYDNLNKSVESHIQLMVQQGAISQATADQIIKSSRSERDSVISTSQEILAVNQQISDQSRSFEFGWSKAFADYIDNATNAATTAQSLFKRFSSGMEDYLVNATKNMKGSWKSFVASMLEELLRSQIRQTMASLFTMGGGQVKGGGGGLFGGSIIPGILAAGGPVSDRRPYIVGERGPELFVPNSAGSMVPNSGLGGGSSVTYNISAVDAMSFKQMIARDPGFIHAIATQGGKSTPVRR